MKKTLLIALIFSGILFAQDAPKSGWTNKLAVGLGVGQIAYSNWTKGGEDQLSWTFNLTGSSVYENSSLKWDNALKVSYGKNQTGDGINKTMQNDLLFNSLLSIKSGWALDYFAGVNVITQIAPGYSYDAPQAVQINGLFDPADVTESVGLVYSKGDYFKSQLGLGFHEVFAGTYYAKTDDPTTEEIEKSIFETGIESITTFRWDIAENVSWASYLRLFSAFDRLDTWDVRWDNTLVGKVNSWLNVNITWIVVYDVTESLKTQAKEALQLGISYNIL
jgi:hypothetical protein